MGIPRRDRVGCQSYATVCYHSLLYPPSFIFDFNQDISVNVNASLHMPHTPKQHTNIEVIRGIGRRVFRTCMCVFFLLILFINHNIDGYLSSRTALHSSRRVKLLVFRVHSELFFGHKLLASDELKSQYSRDISTPKGAIGVCQMVTFIDEKGQRVFSLSYLIRLRYVH